MILDSAGLALALYLAYVIRHGFVSRYAMNDYVNIGIIMIAANFVLTIARNSFKNVIRRGYLKELGETFLQISLVILFIVVYLFFRQRSAIFSRYIIVMAWFLGILIIFVLRSLLKAVIRDVVKKSDNKSPIALVSSPDLVTATVNDLMDREYRDYTVTEIFVTGDICITGDTIRDIPVVYSSDEFYEHIKKNIIEEVFINVSDSYDLPDDLIEKVVDAGIIVHQNLLSVTRGSGTTDVDDFAGYTVLTSSLNVMSYWDVFIKRLADIAGSIVGMILTVLMYPFIAVAVKRKSPGPVIFKQVRVGKNGRRFNLYKFRSMYTDAESRKKDLAADNEMTGPIFKIKDDPRIIPGVGEFIRRTSLDEFPQFFNVFEGTMSLVGTRPPTVDEYKQYDLNHKVRLSMKPGITGLWQVSGRNQISDFDEVVKLDIKYIKEWSIYLDIKILLKTISLMFKGGGE